MSALCSPDDLRLNIALYRKWQRGIRRVLLMTRIQSYGVESLPHQGPLILAANHLSWKDILFVGGMIERPVSFVATERLFDENLCRQMLREYFNPILRRSLPERAAERFYLYMARFLVARVRHSGAFPATLGLSELNLIEGIIKAVLQSKCVFIFPEGGTARPGRIKRFKLGLSHALYELETVHRCRVPVHPVGITGTRNVLHPGMRLGFRVSEPIYLRDYMLEGKWESLMAFAKALRARVAPLAGAALSSK